MWIPYLDSRHLQSRQDPNTSNQGGDKNTSFIIGATVIVFIISSFVVTFTVLRALRRRDYSPKLLPGKYLKQKWKNWNPGKAYGQVPGGSTPDRNQDTSYNPVTTVSSEMNTTSGLRRDSSIRSVITLPAYSVTPKPTEQVIAREGERAGMDVVVEFPETADEEESRREEQMEALYQIRLRRRREIEAREERRRERREARNRGDLARLEELRRESVRRHSGDTNNANSPAPSAATMLAEHRSRSRQRRISSVSYADLGQVRHDGSRLRANSADSDQAPLLDSAGAMGTEARPSLSSSRTNSHFRGDSGSSMMSASTGGSDTDTLNPVVSQSSTGTGVTEHDEVDVGASQIPPPPDYEEVGLGDAPPYESPTSERRPAIPQLGPIANIPAIHIDVATPLTATPNTPRFPPVRDSEDSTRSDHESVSGHQ
ncbi:hypothetical protein Plec18170_006686 [Paecilomyces lecythidis]